MNSFTVRIQIDDKPLRDYLVTAPDPTQAAFTARDHFDKLVSVETWEASADRPIESYDARLESPAQ